MLNSSSQERISQKMSQNSGKKPKSNVAIIAVSSIVGVAAVAGIATFALVSTQKPAETESRSKLVTPDNVEEILAQEPEKVEVGTYEVTMNSTWHFEKGDVASSDAYVENSTSNSNDVYFDVVRTDTNETILKSPIIPVGSHLTDITLDTPLEDGSYECVLTYHLLNDKQDPSVPSILQYGLRLDSKMGDRRVLSMV